MLMNPSHSEMPIFSRKQTTEEKRLLERKLYLARERPDEFFDLSSCGLKEVPAGTYSFIKVLRKTHLLLQNNSLRELDGGGKLCDLKLLKVLNLSSNEIRLLPPGLELLSSLQVLLATDNRISTFPCCLINLTGLHTLNLEGNQIRTIPPEIGQMSCLVNLHLDRNPITHLPEQLAHLNRLEQLTIPVDSMVSPPPDICAKGIHEVFRYLNGGNPPPFHLPNQVSDRVLTTAPRPTSPSEGLTSCTDAPLSTVPHDMHENRGESQRLRALELERHLEESQQAHFELAQRATEARKQVLNRLTEEEAQLHMELTAVQQQRDRERNALVTGLLHAEESAATLVRQLLAEQARAKHTEAADDEISMQLLEKPDASFKLRREETLASMERMLALTADAYHKHAARRDAVTQRTLHAGESESGHFDRILAIRSADQQKLSLELASKEEAQREAFAELFARQDRQAQRLQHEIALVEQELCRLTIAEQNRKAERTEVNQRCLAERRQELLELLMQLNKDQEQRRNELHRRMIEMEDRRQKDQLDYWLIQYQRLLDNKPPELAAEVDEDVWHVLKSAEALDFLPNFKYHRITASNLSSLTDEQLQRMGVYAVGVRQTILTRIEDLLAERSKQSKLTDLENRATAPPPEVECEYIIPTAPPHLIARFENECCICQNAACTTIFLQCAHVCTCQKCGEQLETCPLCRAPISQRIQLQC